MKTKTKKRYRIRSKFRFITSIVVMMGLAVGIFGVLSGLDVSRAITKPQYTQVEICSGDTLWDIAATYGSNDTDMRKAVYKLCKINDIEASDLTPGMVIDVPKEL